MTLRERQAPLKAQYKEHPQAALVTHHAVGKLGTDVTCAVEVKDGTIVAGLHPAAGGSGEYACSGDMMLQALAACTGVTMNAVSTAMGLQLRSASIQVSGVLDYRGTLGVAREIPVGFKSIHIEFILDTDEPREKLEKLVELTERYCVVFQTIKHGPVLTASITHP